MRDTTLFRVKYLIEKLRMKGINHLVDLGRTHPLRVRNLRAAAAAADYIDSNMPKALGFETQKELLDYAIGEVRCEGHYLEFGVAGGGTIRFIAGKVPNRQVHGFDSFEGLPEAWSGTGIGRKTFSRAGRPPRVPTNVILHKGWFSDTVPGWSETNPGPIAFLHVDCDLYSSTRDILVALGNRLQPGAVIVFDEYFNYPSWEDHESKAWQEFVEAERELRIPRIRSKPGRCARAGALTVEARALAARHRREILSGRCRRRMWNWCAESTRVGREAISALGPT